MRVEFSSEASVVALYGIQFSASCAKVSYNALVDWFGSLGFYPDRSGVTGRGFSLEVGTFDRFDRQLKRSGFDEVGGFNLYRLVPGGDIPGYHWYVNATVDEEDSYCIMGARSSIAPLPGDSFLTIARSMIRILRPVYGIGYRRKMDLGPVFYGIGGCVGLNPWGAEKPLGERIDKWRELGIEQRLYEKGFLRDVYPWNFLTSIQLSRPVEGVALLEWIQQGTKRGLLSLLEGDMWLWEVGETQLPHVRTVMENAGMIFDVTTGGRT